MFFFCCCCSFSLQLFNPVGCRSNLGRFEIPEDVVNVSSRQRRGLEEGSSAIRCPHGHTLPDLGIHGDERTAWRQASYLGCFVCTTTYFCIFILFFSLKRDLAKLDSSLERGNSSLTRKFSCSAHPMPFQLGTIRVVGCLQWDNLLLLHSPWGQKSLLLWCRNMGPVYAFRSWIFTWCCCKRRP